MCVSTAECCVSSVTRLKKPENLQRETEEKLVLRWSENCRYTLLIAGDVERLWRSSETESSCSSSHTQSRRGRQPPTQQSHSLLMTPWPTDPVYDPHWPSYPVTSVIISLCCMDTMCLEASALSRHHSSSTAVTTTSEIDVMKLSFCVKSCFCILSSF